MGKEVYLTRVKFIKKMNDPQKLIDIARQIDPDLKDREQALIDALLVIKALAILEGQEAKPVSLIHIPRQIKEATKEINGVVGEADKKTLARMMAKFLQRKGIRASSFAREMEVSVSTVHGWLSGKWYPQDKYRARIGQILSGSIQLRPSPYDQAEEATEDNQG